MTTQSRTRSLVWRLRDKLSPTARGRVRRWADVVLAPVGSLAGARTGSRAVGLTFDDGPDPVVTPALLDLLAERDVRATFFLLTSRAIAHPRLVTRMVEAGHEVALHSDTHDRLTLVATGELRRRLGSARTMLEDLAGRRVRYFRPPFGAQSVRTYLAARACGLDVVVWGPYAQDWVDDAPDVVAARGLVGLEPGSILLLHDGLVVPPGSVPPTFDRIAMFRLLLDGAAERRLRGGTVSALVSEGSPRRTAWFRP
ncbi:MAG: polysaccharide deacetylase family protein [Georgenia sp.]